MSIHTVANGPFQWQPGGTEWIGAGGAERPLLSSTHPKGEDRGDPQRAGPWGACKGLLRGKLTSHLDGPALLSRPGCRLLHWLLAISTSQGTPRSLLQSHSLQASSSALRLLYGPALTSVHDPRKTVALTIWTLVGKVMSLHFNKLSRFVIAFLPRSKFDFGAKEKKICHRFHFFPYMPWSNGTGCLDLSFLMLFQASFFPASWPSSRGRFLFTFCH